MLQNSDQILWSPGKNAGLGVKGSNTSQTGGFKQAFLPIYLSFIYSTKKWVHQSPYLRSLKCVKVDIVGAMESEPPFPEKSPCASQTFGLFELGQTNITSQKTISKASRTVDVLTTGTDDLGLSI